MDKGEYVELVIAPSSSTQPTSGPSTSNVVTTPTSKDEKDHIPSFEKQQSCRSEPSYVEIESLRDTNNNVNNINEGSDGRSHMFKIPTLILIFIVIIVLALVLQHRILRKPESISSPSNKN